MLTQRINPKTGKNEYALVSVSSPGKVLKWFGTEKPSDEEVDPGPLTPINGREGKKTPAPFLPIPGL